MTGKHILRWTLVAAAAGVLFAAGVAWWAVSTQSASRRVIAWVLGKSAAGVQIREVRGPLRGPLLLLGVRYRSGALSAEVDSVYLEWRLKRLIRRQVHIDKLYLTGFRVIIPDSAPPDTAGTRRARREKPNTPVPVTLGDVRVRGFEMDAPGGVTLRRGELDLDGALDDYRFAIRGTAFVPRVDTTTVELHGRGNLEGVTLDEQSRARALSGALRTEGRVQWWPGITWELAVVGDSLEPSRMLPNPAALPGRIGVFATTKGRIDSAGPAGSLVVDSMRGVLRGQRVSGRAEAQFTQALVEHLALDASWGGARVRAEGEILDTLALDYTVSVRELRAFHPRAGGLLTIQGEARGPRLTPRVLARVHGAGLTFGTSRLERLAGRADFDLVEGGRTSLDLEGDSAVVGQADLDRILVSLKGTQRRHTLTANAVGPADTVRIALDGGLVRQVWNGRISEVDVRTLYADWTLDRPARAVVAANAVRVDSLCFVGDSAAGRICAAGDWRRPNRLDVLATVEDLALERFPIPGLRGVLRGRLSARLEAHQTDALRGALAARLADPDGAELAVLDGRATLPGYRLGMPFERQRLELTATGRAQDLRPFEPLVPRADSLRGSADFELTVGGTVRAPSVDGTLRGTDLVVGLPGTRTARGSVELGVDVDVARDRTFRGEVRLTQRDVALEYRRGRDRERVSLDSGAVVVTGGPDGARGTFGFAVRTATDSVGSIAGVIGLPGYTRLDLPLASQPLALRFDVALAMAALQPFAPLVDSLSGSVDVELAVDGTIGMPQVTGRAQVQQASGVFPFGTRFQGGLTGELDITVRTDSTVTGTLRVVPEGVRFQSIGGQPGSVALDQTSLEVRAGADGVHGTLKSRLVSSDGTLIGTLEGSGGMPRYTRVGRPLARETVEGRVEGRIDDLRFLPAFSALVDSAGGRLAFQARLQGTVAGADLVGRMELRDAAFKLPTLGATYHDVNLTAIGSDEGMIAIDGAMRSGEGRITFEGVSPTRPTSASPGRMLIRGTDFLVANNAEVRATFSPALDVTLAGDSVSVHGSVDVPLARMQLSEIPVVAIAPSDDVILTDPGARGRRDRPLVARVRLTLGDSVSFRGFNFDARLGGSVLVMAAPDQLTRASGQIVIIEGQYKAYGQDLAVENGMVRFAGGPIDNPTLSIRAIRFATDSTIAGIAMAGSLKEPVVTLFSTPPMSQTQILSYIVTGHPVGQGGGSSGNLINKALSALGLQGGNVITGALGKEVGLDEATIETEEDLEQASLKIGRYLSPNLYVSYGIGIFDPISTLRLRYVLSRRWTLQAQTGEETGADALLKIQRKR